MGAFLSAVNNGRAPPSQIIDVMSIYHPFPLRLDSLNKGAPVQYDACLQLGEFPSDKYKGNTAVVLFPLKISRNPGSKGKFMDGIASKIQTILGQQPDPINGYPDVPAHTGADWSIEDILFMQNKAGETVSRAFYAWINRTPFPVGVVVMAEPVYISQTNMDAIKRLPITPPSDVIHEIGTPILYKPGPIFDEEGNPQPCPATKAELAKKAMNSIVQPPLPPKKGGIDLDLFFQIVLGTLASVVVILGVWMGIKLAMGPGSTVMKSLGDSLGKSLAGGYEAIKKAKLPVMPAIPKIPQSVKDSVNKTRKNLGNRLGLGATGKFGPKRQPVQTDAPSGDIQMTTNPLLNRDKTRKNKPGTIGAIANLPATNIPGGPLPPHLRGRKTNVASTLRNPKPGTIGAITNLPAANIPEPAPAPAPAPAPGSVPSLENIVQDMPPGVTVNPAVARRRSARNRRRSSVNSIKNLPELTDTPPPKDTPAAISNLPTPVVNPALQNLEGIERRKQAKSSILKKLSAANQAKKALGEVRAVRELDSASGDEPAPAPAPAPAKSSRSKTLRNSLSKISAAKDAEKRLGRVRAVRELDSASGDEFVSDPNPLYNKEKPKSEATPEATKKEPVNARWTKMLENKKRESEQKKPWNPSTKINSPSRFGKGRHKRRNRRKTGHHLRNRKKTGRKI